MAVTPDALVGLFLRAQRTGDSSLETAAPVSRDNFLNDLKSLASELEQFESPAPHFPTSFVKSNVEIHSEPPVTMPTPTVKPASQSSLDTKSNELIQDVKKQLNLSSDNEVIRLLLVLGYERAKTIFPSK
jgi:hypothetical protein